MRPYIGITDFTEYWQVERMLEIFNKLLPEGSDRQLHIGVMMSYKTLFDLKTKFASVFPEKDEIASIFGSDETYDCLHIADYDNNPGLSETLATAISYGGIGIDAIQLDMIWPEPSEITQGVHISRKQIEVILQVGTNALRLVNDRPSDLVEALADYEGIIDRVLLDKSMGRGKPMDPEVLLPFARAIKKAYPDLGLVFAGGLCKENAHLMVPIYEEFPNASSDAQGQLRPSGSALDPVSWPMAANYLIEMLKLAPS